MFSWILTRLERPSSLLNLKRLLCISLPQSHDSPSTVKLFCFKQVWNSFLKPKFVKFQAKTELEQEQELSAKFFSYSWWDVRLFWALTAFFNKSLPSVIENHTLFFLLLLNAINAQVRRHTWPQSSVVFPRQPLFLHHHHHHSHLESKTLKHQIVLVIIRNPALTGILTFLES